MIFVINFLTFNEYLLININAAKSQNNLSISKLEIDGLSSGDKGGLNTLITILNNKQKFKIILVCNIGC